MKGQTDRRKIKTVCCIDACFTFLFVLFAIFSLILMDVYVGFGLFSLLLALLSEKGLAPMSRNHGQVFTA